MNISAIVKNQQVFYNTRVTKDIRFRIKYLKKLECWIRTHDKDIMRALGTDLNKPPFEAYATEIGVVLDELRYIIKRIPRWSRPKYVTSNLKNFPSHGRRYPEPYGVVLIMSPWNYPFMLTVTPIIAAVAAGNCAVVKPSAYAPATSALIACMVKEVFYTRHVMVVEGGRFENEQLLDERYDKILFTGSTAVGRRVMEAAAKHLTPVTLELGGKSPCIVDETADIRLAAKRIVWGKFINAGQTCVAPDYLLVHHTVKEKLIDEIIKAIVKAYGKNPCSSPDLCKIINEKHYRRLIGLLSGQNVIYSGGCDEKDNKLGPTLIDNHSWDSDLMADEIFGPILPVLTYSHSEEAVKIITAHPKPLAFYLFSRHKSAERYFLQNISFGGGCINDTVMHLSVAKLPFGGVGESGMGCYHGKAGFDAFTHYRSVLHKSKLIDIPLRYPPYTDLALKLLKMV